MNTATLDTKTVPPEWEGWLRENLARNTPEATLVDVMVKSRFDKAAALECIASIRSASTARPRDGLPTPLPRAWQEWLEDNIAKGVVEQTLVNEATRAIRDVWARRLAELRRQGESRPYTYEAPAFSAGTSLKTTDRDVSVLMDMDRPRIVLFGNVLSKEECEQMIALARPRIVPSVTLDNATSQPVVAPRRSSMGTFLKLGETDLVARIERRLADLANWPVDKGEGLQVLHYKDGGEYVPHFDFFPPEQPGSLRLLEHGGQRVATVIVYLNTVEEGGETYFPELNLKIKAVQGHALYFHYTNSKSEVDRMTLHGGGPATKGEKWIMTKWLRQEVVPQRSPRKTGE